MFDEEFESWSKEQKLRRIYIKLMLGMALTEKGTGVLGSVQYANRGGQEG